MGPNRLSKSRPLRSTIICLLCLCMSQPHPPVKAAMAMYTIPMTRAMVLRPAAVYRATARPPRRTQMCCHFMNVRSLASHTLGSILSGPAFLIHVSGSTTPSGSCTFSFFRSRAYRVRMEKLGMMVPRALGWLERAGHVAEETTHDLFVGGTPGFLLFLLFKGGLRVLADILVQVAQPEWKGVDVVVEEDCYSVDELGKSVGRVDQMRGHQVLDPFWPLAPPIFLQLDLQQSIGEPRDFTLVDVLEGVSYIPVVNVEPVPLVGVTAGPSGVQCVLANEGQVRIDCDANPVIGRLLECRALVVRPDHWLQLALHDEVLDAIDRGLETGDLFLALALSLHLRDSLLHLVLAINESLNIFGLDGELAFLAAASLVDDLLVEEDLGRRAQRAIPPKPKRRRLRLSPYLPLVQVKLGVIEVEGSQAGILMSVCLLGRNLAVDKVGQTAQDEGLDLEKVVGILLHAALQLCHDPIADALFQLLLDGEIGQREPVDQRSIRMLRVERPIRQLLHHQRPDLVPQPSLPVMLLHNLQETGVVEVAIPLQLVDLVRDGVQLGLELLQLLGGGVAPGLAVLGGGQLLEPLEGGVDAVLQLPELALVEAGDLLQLDVEDFVGELGLVVVGPRLVVIVRVVLAEQALQLGVVEVVVLPWLVDGGL
ncbi:hypothetical protein VP1G_11034 [Cytospora mali]|uniref:Uncharacterized protein n=1 Tax=Cytospora mali TaxID=578113 RepID=A0A194V454_CYTMA|nr:hypothetical protein VP1G_11034 [Valsa mali var. pyri (nom. inval.)]